MYIVSKNRLQENEFLEKIKQLYLDTEVNLLDEKVDPYPYDMFLSEVYEIIVLAKYL